MLRKGKRNEIVVCTVESRLFLFSNEMLFVELGIIHEYIAFIENSQDFDKKKEKEMMDATSLVLSSRSRRHVTVADMYHSTYSRTHEDVTRVVR